MLNYFLPFLSLLVQFTFAGSTNSHLVVPRAPTIHAHNTPICYDGQGLRFKVLTDTVRDDCKNMWKTRLKFRTGPSAEPFYQPNHEHYPLYLLGAPGGCGFRIDQPPRRRILDIPPASVRPDQVKWIDDRIAEAFWQVLTHCVERRVGGIMFYSTAPGPEQVKFMVSVGLQQPTATDSSQVRHVYAGLEPGASRMDYAPPSIGGAGTS